jgi:transposase
MDTIIQPAIRQGKRGPYRRHTVEFKRAVVEQSLSSSASVSRIARQHNVNANQVFSWRKLYREGLLGGRPDDSVKLLPVTLTEPPGTAPVSRALCAAAVAEGAIQLEIGKTRLRIEGSVDAAALALVLEHLLR